MYKNSKIPKVGLKRSLSLFEATLYGVGIIFGAGIYVLIGEAAGIAGNAIWLSFIAAGMLAAFTALSYAELSSAFPRTAAEFVFVKKMFGSKMLAFSIGYLTIATGIISTATVALGFAGYFTALIPLPTLAVAVALVAVMALVNFLGISLSAKLNVLLTLFESAGLLLVIAFGASFLGGVDYFALPVQAPNMLSYLSVVMTAAALIFFAYLGFEGLANMAEETRDPRKTIPKAMLLSLFFSTVVYILVSLIVVSVVPFQQLAESAAPLKTVADTALPGLGVIVAVMGLFATFNTVLIMQTVTPRILYGVAREHSLPEFLSRVHPRTRTPHFAIAITAAMIILFVLSGSIRQVAFLTDFGVFLIFIAINASVIALRFKLPEPFAWFRMPVNIGRLPLLPVLGILFSIYMLLHFMQPAEFLGIKMPLAMFGIILAGLSVPIYFVFNPPMRRGLKRFR